MGSTIGRTGYSGPKGAGGLNTAARNAARQMEAGRGLSTSAMTAPGGMRTYAGPKGVGALNTGARMASARSLGFSAPSVRASPAEVDLMARTMIAESGSIRNPMGGLLTPALQAVGDVVRNRVLSEKFPTTVQGVLTQKKQFSPFNKTKSGRPIDSVTTSHPDFAATRKIAESILAGETAPTVGNSLHFGNMHTIMNKPGYSSAATKRNFQGMNVAGTFKDAKNPNSRQHSFGTIGTSDVAFGGPGPVRGATQLASKAPASPANVASTFPARPQMAPDFSSRVAGRPAPQQAFASMIAARPQPQPAFNSMIAARPQPPQTFNSQIAARPEKTGLGFPAAMASTFPARPQPQPGFASQIASRPSPPQTFSSAIAGKPDFPGSLPAAPVTAEFPGRPSAPIGFASQIAGRPAPPQTFNSQIASRTSPPGGFPAAPQPTSVAADPAQFADSPYGQGLAALGENFRSGIGALNEGMRQFEAHKGKLALANKFGINPIGKATKQALSGAIKAGQNKLGSAVASIGQPTGAAQMAASGSPSPQAQAPSAAPQSPAPQSPPAVAAVQQQRNTLIGMLRDIMGNGGPKTLQEQKKAVRIAQAIQALPALDYSVTEATI
jgi:hypothetical protein